MEIESGEMVARGLSMPHSPRYYAGKLWLLDSGTGRLVTVDEKTATVATIAELPGFTRGLAFFGRFAFVGLSRIRETSTFGDLPIAERRGELKCGIWIVDVETGSTVAFTQFQSGVEEIFDLQIAPTLRFPSIIGFEKETINGTFVVPMATANQTIIGRPSRAV